MTAIQKYLPKIILIDIKTRNKNCNRRTSVNRNSYEPKFQTIKDTAKYAYPIKDGALKQAFTKVVPVITD